MLHQRTASSRDSPTSARAGVTSAGGPVGGGSARAAGPSPSKDKDKIRQWAFPRPASPSRPPSVTSPGAHALAFGQGGASASTGPTAAQGLSSATSAAGAAGANGWTTHGQTRADSLPPGGDSPAPQSTPRFAYPPSPPTTHRATGSVSLAYQSSPTASALPLRARLGPLVLAKVLYANLRRASVNDIFYGLVFLGSLLIFFGALSGQGYSPADALVRADRARDWPVRSDQRGARAAVNIDIPTAFLPLEDEDGDIPADVHQPHGDSSHDRGADLLRDSPEDPNLDDDQTHQVQQRRGREALFGKHTDEHASAHAEADAVLSSDSSSSLPLSEKDDDDDDDDDDDEDEDEDDPATVTLPAEAAPHEDSFNAAHPLHIIPEDAGDLSPPDFFQPETLPPAVPPAIIMAPDSAQALGDSFRRPAGRAGLEELREGRAAMGREREAAVAGESVAEPEGEGEGVRRQRRAREVR